MMSEFLILNLSGLAKGRVFMDLHQILWVKEFMMEDNTRLETRVKMAGEMDSFAVQESMDSILKAIRAMTGEDS